MTSSPLRECSVLRIARSFSAATDLHCGKTSTAGGTTPGEHNARRAALLLDPVPDDAALHTPHDPAVQPLQQPAPPPHPTSHAVLHATAAPSEMGAFCTCRWRAQGDVHCHGQHQQLQKGRALPGQHDVSERVLAWCAAFSS
eukprot:CAMPEP_0181344444 /NCGR_PEP_ID=MMETSP1101-20121128/32176_1 /TAXON_ID=46948 /ORGANISM="Rhodomonas abbreviata, Strain Caron Lab Isolate" /LENGTH=141 /DNA_ID=CAMNT_0023456247 /DNA_START=1099 /DNA_END=1525 /DNA_ORIENTATION=-